MQSFFKPKKKTDRSGAVTRRDSKLANVNLVMMLSGSFQHHHRTVQASTVLTHLPRTNREPHPDL